MGRTSEEDEMGGSEGGEEGLTGGNFDVWLSGLAQALGVAGEKMRGTKPGG